jgi:protein TonB
MRVLIAVAVIGVVGCHGSSPQSDAGDQSAQAAPPPESEAPVALNPDVPIAYPPALYDQKVEADVTLRLFVDSTGKLVPESTRVAEASGYPALDSAALAGSRALRFAPAKRHGVPVATAFLQPVEFRQVGTTRTGTVTLPPAPAATPTPPPAPAPARPRSPPPAPVVRPKPDSTRTAGDTTRARADTTRPSPDTTKARTDTSATTH